MNARIKAIVGFVALSLFCAAASPVMAAVRVFKLDAVELIKNGKEVNGDQKHEVVRDGYTYCFASDANKKAFEAEPTRFEIQIGGACGRMGPLSGSGNPKLYAVHDGRLYLFASPQCKSAFLKAPAKCIEVDDKPVAADAAWKSKKGLELLEKAIKAHGGASAIDAVKTYRQTIETTTIERGAKYDNKFTLTFAYPDRIRDESCWNDNCWAYVVDGTRGASLTDRGFDTPLAASQVRAVKRKANENLISVLKARRSRPDFVVTYLVIMQQPPDAGEVISISYDGMTRELEIDRQANRVKWLRYKGRDKRDEIDQVNIEFVDFETIEGVLVPISWKSSANPEGKDKLIRASKVEINSKIDDKLFAVAPPK